MLGVVPVNQTKFSGENGTALFQSLTIIGITGHGTAAKHEAAEPERENYARADGGCDKHRPLPRTASINRSFTQRR